jgi:hypothetical protein
LPNSIACAYMTVGKVSGGESKIVLGEKAGFCYGDPIYCVNVSRKLASGTEV